MSNSSLVSVKILSPSITSPRNHIIDTITIHCMAGNMTVESCGIMFANPSRRTSSNYGIGSDGRIGLYVDEENRSWCSSNKNNDNRAVTIEVANDGGAETGWHVSNAAYKSLVTLCADICRRNNIPELRWRGDKSLIGQVDKQNMTVHRWFKNKACPGDYLYGLHGRIADEVNAVLRENHDQDDKPIFRVQTGAFESQTNAKLALSKVKAAGFEAFIVRTDSLYKVQVGAYSSEKNAYLVIAKLKAAGFDAFIAYDSEQPIAKKTVDQVVREVIRGLWGVGEDRKERLEKAGYSYSDIQKRVNKLM